MSKAVLIDTTKCIGCRSCQVSCKEWNGLPGEATTLPRQGLGLQNPVSVSSKTLTLMTYHEFEDAGSPGGVKYIFAKRQCMHCDDPACASACPVTALHKTVDGPVTYDSGKCIGCRYCVWACPFGAPTVQWDSLAPEIRKCTLCYDRISQPAPEARNGHKLTDEEKKRFTEQEAVPLCVKQCPSGALKFGERDALLAEAKGRIQAHPQRYVDHIYGEHEAGGTSTFYLSSVPFAALGFPQVGMSAYPAVSADVFRAVPPAFVGVGALLGGSYALYQRRAAVEQAQEAAVVSTSAALPVASPAKKPAPKPGATHVDFAANPGKGRSLTESFLLALAGLGGLSFLLRFALGLGGSTNLSDTYPWGLWIAFDFAWIAIAAGAFTMAALIYVFHREDLYPLGRSAILMGLLSYSFVVIVLVADLGLPWHFWQLGVQAPRHSAMFEVSWCIFLYLTVLAFEFLPIPCERWGLAPVMALWRKYSPLYVVAATTLFMYLMSRNLAYTSLALAVFGFLAYAFRPRPGEKQVPIMLAIAAVAFSTMHQSSLGALFLLMPDKLNVLWWSPVMPLLYFLSSLAAGTGLVILVEMWIAKGFGRAIPIAPLAAIGKVTFASLLVYELARIADVLLRGEFPRAVVGRPGLLFLAEFFVFGLLPLFLLLTDRLRYRPGTLGLASFFTVAGVIFNRASAVFFAMDLRGPMPQIAPHAYVPSVWEWGVSIGAIATSVLLFRWAARTMPVLPKQEATPFSSAD